MNKKKKLIVVIPENLSFGVINSQIFDFFDKLDSVEIYYLSKNKINISKPNLYYIEKYSEIQNFINKEYPQYIYIRSSLQYLKLFFYVKKFNIKTIYGFRALIFIESYYKNKNIFKSFILYLIEFFAYLTANKITSVTYKLRDKLRLFFVFKRECPIIPCYCVTNFDKQINTSEELKMVYIGGASKWQCSEEMFYLLEKIIDYIPKTTLTIYSNDQQHFKNLLKACPQNIQNKVFLVSKLRSELIEELPVYDIGFLLRDKSLVNTTASPIKFYEYVNAGVVPLITPYVGDISDNKKVKNFAFYYDFNDSSIELLVEDIKIFLNNKSIVKDKMKIFEDEVNFQIGLNTFYKLLE